MSSTTRLHRFWRRHRVWLLCQAVSWLVVAYASMSADGDNDVFIIRGVLAMPALVGLLLAWKRDLEMRALLILDAVASASLFLGLTVLLDNRRSSGFVEFFAAPVAWPAWLLSFLGILLVDAHLIGLRMAAGMGTVRAVTLHPTLQQRGYHWLTPDQTRELWELCGEAAFRLPPWEDLGTLPGIAEGDLAALARVAEDLGPGGRFGPNFH